MPGPGMDGNGTKLERRVSGGGGSSNWVELANSTQIDLPSLSKEEIDVSHHKSPDKYMQFIPGMKDPGEVSVDCNYMPDPHDDWVMEDYEGDDVNRYRIVLPDPEEHYWEFDAFVTGYEPSAPHDDKAEASITFKVTGKPELGTLNGDNGDNGDNGGGGGGDD